MLLNTECLLSFAPRPDFHSSILQREQKQRCKKLEVLDKPGFIWLSFILNEVGNNFDVIWWLISSIWQNNALLQIFCWVQKLLIFCNQGATYSDLLGRFLYDGLVVGCRVQTMLVYATICINLLKVVIIKELQSHC